MRWSTTAIACLGLAALSASAQVHRCKDAAGKIIYSDQPCATGQVGGQIERQRSRAEIIQERDQAYDAELRKQERRLAEQERVWAEPQRHAQPSQAPSVPQVRDDWQSRKDQENAAASARSITKNGGRWDTRAEAERAQERRNEARRRDAEQPGASIITHCNTGFC